MPEDLDGNGKILQMRGKTPPDNGRFLKKIPASWQTQAG